MIRFLLDQELVELTSVSPDLTVLDWLRIYRRRTGTKEGCGSGDCGACTVVLASVNEQEDGQPQLTYQSINSCITFIGALHGKQLLTVESLATNGELHPVQQCMVNEHGSQCGFCTPGFVMSLYALYQQNSDTETLKANVEQALGGNLCRCTGYRPIVQAAENALDMKKSVKTPTELNGEESNTLNKLVQINKEAANIVGFYQPDNLPAFTTFLQSNPTARILAGGTDLALEVTQQMRNLPSIVSVNAVPELKSIQLGENQIELGAAVTLNDCMSVLQDRIPGSRELLLRFGSDQVRNQGTIGGNIGSASPIGDLPPLLIALDATITLQKGDDTRTIALEDHYLGYRQTTLQSGEFIRSVNIPLPAVEDHFSVHKISKRTDDDISSVCLAVYLPMRNGVVNNARLAFGGMAATPVRAKDAEHKLNGTEFSQVSVLQAQEAIALELKPMSDARASAAYRLQVAQNLLQRVLLEVQSS